MHATRGCVFRVTCIYIIQRRFSLQLMKDNMKTLPNYLFSVCVRVWSGCGGGQVHYTSKFWGPLLSTIVSYLHQLLQ